MRIGLGYDIHGLVFGRELILGGVHIPYEKGPLGHSDGDCVLHALTDALLGALALGDIGHYFSDTDPRWKNAKSTVFLEEALRLITEKNYRITNLDGNILLEKPKLAPHIQDMRNNLAKILKINPEQVSLKAKRGEGFDAVGKGEAISCQIIVLLEKLPTTLNI